MSSDAYKLRRQEVSRICLERASHESGGPTWSGISHLSPDEPSIDSPIDRYDPSLRQQVISLYEKYNDLASRYNEIEANFGRSHQRVDPHLLNELLAKAVKSIKVAVELNRQNRLLIHPLPVTESNSEAEEAYLNGPMVNILEVASASAYIKYMQDRDVGSFKRIVGDLLSATGGHGWTRGTERLDKRGLPRLVSPEAAGYALMLYYALDRDMASSERAVLSVLLKRSAMSSQMYYPVRILENQAPFIAPSWDKIFSEIEKHEFDHGWQCSLLFEMATEWLQLVSVAAIYNGDKDLIRVTRDRIKQLITVADMSSAKPGWPPQARQIAQKLNQQKE